MAPNDILDPKIWRANCLIWLVRQSVIDPTCHVAYQPNDTDGPVCVIAPDLDRLSRSLEWGVQPTNRAAVAAALAELYIWAQGNQENALKLGLIVPENQPDEDLTVQSGLVIVLSQLVELRKHQVRMVLLAP